ncbi:MAG: DUF58 domain-containing protein [Oscillospiraceae bacterium]|nr:DUF58 domain-containing protein [Oscillospiraceae bacterium]
MAKNWLVYGMVVFTLLIFIFLRPLPMTYWALYAVLLAPLVSLFFALVSSLQSRKHGFAMTAALDSSQVEKGQLARYTLTIQNHSIFPHFCVRVCFQVEQAALFVDCRESSLFVPARKCASATVSVRSNYRGNYAIGPDAIFLYDCLGLFRWKKRLPPPRPLCVVPWIYPISALPLDTGHRGEAAATNQIPQADYSEISDLRQYRPSDSFRNIHWKASAKRGELISKHFQDTGAHTVFLCIDNSVMQGSDEAALVLEDQMMDALVSVMAHCTERGYRTVLHHMGAHNPAPVADFHRLFQTAAHLDFDGSGNFDGYLLSFLHTYRTCANLILLLQELTPATVSALQSYGARGQHVLVFSFGEVETAHMKQLQQAGVTCLDFCNVIQKEAADENT